MLWKMSKWDLKGVPFIVLQLQIENSLRSCMVSEKQLALIFGENVMFMCKRKAA